MSCGHKFNYIPLYHDILNHKKKFNNMEGSATRLKQNELRCPYCRKRSIGLLPHYEEFNLPKVSGVNYIDINYNAETDTIPVSSYYKKCEFLTPNIYFNFNSVNVTEIYNSNSNLNLEDCKYIKCNHMGTQFNHEQILEFSSDDKYYCWNHKKVVVKNNKKLKADKIKEEKLKLKEEEKLKANAEKLKLKEKEKEEKLKLKEELKKSVQMAKMNKNTKHTVNNNVENENVVIGLSEAKNVVESEAKNEAKNVVESEAKNVVESEAKNVVESEAKDEAEPILLCQEILKTGKNKGAQCGNKIVENNLCKRHSKKDCN